MSYCAEILAVGTEILLGDIVNTDAQTVSQALSELGINVYYSTVVGDNPKRLRRAVEIARGRANIIITTGGLGPTFDDLTKQTLAEVFGLELVLDQAELAKIRAYFEKIGREMTPNNERQAWLPKGCTVLKNDWGTAPGCAFEVDGVHVIMLPGPPRECYPMMRERAMPYLRALSDATLVSHEVRIFGVGESAVENRIRAIAEKMDNPTLAPYAKEGEVLLRVTGRAADRAHADALTQPVLKMLQDEFGDLIYGVDVPSLAAVVTAELRKRGCTLATAESCTGGLLSKMVTDLPGASDVFLGGVCTYQNAVKTELLGVPAEVLETEGAVSRACARAMAKGAAERLGADVGIGVTGIAGPGGGSPEKPVGTVYLSVWMDGSYWDKKLSHATDRGRIRNMAALHGLDLIRRALQKRED